MEMTTSLSTILSGVPVFLFSGQGAQKPGMGVDLMDVPEVAASFACASDVLGYDAAGFVAHADSAKLDDTRYAQPTLCALSIGIARALEARGVMPAAMLGFSLGQVAALAVADMLSDEEVFAFVGARAEFMAEAAKAHQGVMSALLKAEEDDVRSLCEECAEGDVLVPANCNCPGQIVISGTPDAVARAEEAWAARGRRFSRLATSGAFHSPLMVDAAEALASYLADLEFREPSIPLICNVDAAPLTALAAREHMAQHLVSPVLFRQSVEALSEAGADTFMEVGYGGVLTGLVRRIDRNARRVCVQDRASFEEAAAAYAEQTEPEAIVSSDHR